MAERHGGQMALPRAVPAVSASHRLSRSGGSTEGLEWRASRNGVPEAARYPLGRQAARDQARDDEVAAQVAAARAEAVRRARKHLGTGPLERKVAARAWEPVSEEEVST